MNGRDILIGIDAGTSVIKSVAFDLTGRQLAVSALPNHYRTGPDGMAVQNMTWTWDETARTLRQLGERLPSLASRVAAIGVTGQGDGTWLIDAAGNPVGDAWLWFDARAASRVDYLKSKPEDKTRYLITGTGLNSCQMGTQLGRMREIIPEVFDAAVTALHCKDWLYFKMTGARHVDSSEAIFTFGDFRTRLYCPRVIEALELESLSHLLPPILDGTRETCPLTPQAALQTGLLAGTPVVLGAIDVICTALGGGLFSKDTTHACTIIGSTGMHLLAKRIEDFTPVEQRSGYVMVLPIPGWILQIQSNMAATLNLDWCLALADGLAQEFGQKLTRHQWIDRMDDWLKQAKPGRLLYHPYISEAGERGPFVDTTARASFIGLKTSHGYPDLLRAIVESLGLSARHCYSAMGRTPEEIVLTGGAARADALCRIFGACLGADLRRTTLEEAGATGAAMMAAVALQCAPDMPTILQDWIGPTLGPLETPDPELVGHYNRLYPAYCESVQAMMPVWKLLQEEILA